jgi:hypothetical protein
MKKLLLSWLAVFVALTALDFLIHGVLLASTYVQIKDLFRPDMESKMWIYNLVGAITSFFFVLIYSKGYEGKGVMEGVRYGFYAGCMLATGMAYGTYAMIAIPYAMAMQWFVYGIIEYIVAGAIVALIYGKKEPAPAA